MTIDSSEVIPLGSELDMVSARHRVRAAAVELGFSIVDQTKLVTAASELARNTLRYAGGGEMRIDRLSDGTRRGVRLTFEDHGPGIADLEAAMRDGYSTGTGLGLGLGGARRLVNDFEIESRPGEGTRVTATRWR